MNDTNCVYYIWPALSLIFLIRAVVGACMYLRVCHKWFVSLLPSYWAVFSFMSNSLQYFWVIVSSTLLDPLFSLPLRLSFVCISTTASIFVLTNFANARILPSLIYSLIRSQLCDNDLPLVTGQLAPVIERIIKRNTDFGKYPGSRRLVESYLKALSRLDKHSRRVPGQSPRKRARSRSAERCLDFNGFKGHQCASARGHKTGSSLSVITCYRPPTIQEQCGAEQGYQVTSSLSVYHASSAASAPSSESNQIGDNATETPSPSNGSSEVFRGTDSPMTNNDRNDSCQDRVIAVSSTGSIINVQVVSDTDTSEGLCARNPQQPFTIGCQQRLEVPAALEDEVFRSDEPEPALPIPSSLKVSSPPRGGCTVEAFTRQMHGDSSVCPHPRILPNLVAVCLSAIYRAFSQK